MDDGTTEVNLLQRKYGRGRSR